MTRTTLSGVDERTVERRRVRAIERLVAQAGQPGTSCDRSERHVVCLLISYTNSFGLLLSFILLGEQFVKWFSKRASAEANFKLGSYQLVQARSFVRDCRFLV